VREACLREGARRVAVPLELAANVHPGETDDRALLDSHGWRLVEPALVAGSGNAFRRYVQGSRGELSCAKPTYVRTRPGWISDRTVCYLASGKPAVVEHTGPSAFLPDDEGLLRFRGPDEAALFLERVTTNYQHHAAQARALAEEHFDARRNVTRVLVIAA